MLRSSLHDPAFTIAIEMPRRKQNDSSFGPLLTAFREARGLTHAQLAVIRAINFLAAMAPERSFVTGIGNAR